MSILSKLKVVFLKQRSLKKKLEYIEEKGIIFQAGYWGKEEVFIATFPDASFLDFHWMNSNSDGTLQSFRPTEIERIVDEIIELGEQHGYNNLEDELTWLQ